MKGKLPITGLIALESDEAQWLMLSKRLIDELFFTALVEKEPNRKVRIKLKITQIFSPDMIMFNGTCSFRSNLGNDASMGIKRISEFFDVHFMKNAWLFMGHIEGEERKPILIIFYQSINLAVYSLKLANDDNFFPVGLN